MFATTSLFLLVLFAQDSQESSEQLQSAKELFLANCASCHGPDGDGKGTTELDRPARSFRDGGFSFGNTPEALFRTLSTGIPGTPMPGFAGALSDKELRLLSTYVRLLGPPANNLEVKGNRLTVAERPRFARGMLPPISEGRQAVTRGLLVGSTDGLTFEFRIDDVRLLGVRQGEFVELNDWTGRGGAALAPLGKIFYLFENGEPRPSFFHTAPGKTQAQPLHAQLSSTYIEGNLPFLSYELKQSDDRILAQVQESCKAAVYPTASGFTRSFSIDSRQKELLLQLRIHEPKSTDLPQELPTLDLLPGDWRIHRRADGIYEIVGVTSPQSDLNVIHQMGERHLILAIPSGNKQDVRITTFLLSGWSAEIREKLIKEMQP